MALKSQIALIVANQLGKIQGEIEARIQSEANKMISKFANQCPNTEELIKIVNTVNNLINGVNKFQKSTNVFSSLATNLNTAINAANIVLKLLKNNPTPVAIGTPPGPSGGLISAQTAGKLTSSADKLYKITQTLEELEGDVKSIQDLVTGITPSLNTVRQVLESVNTKIQDCVIQQSSKGESNIDLESIKDLLNKIQPLENTGSEGIPNEEYLYRGKNGKNYTLAIIQEKQGEGPVPRRLAVAKDNIGVIILRGQPSFSSDTQVLLDELKFRIDNQLP